MLQRRVERAGGCVCWEYAGEFPFRPVREMKRETEEKRRQPVAKYV